MYINTGQPVHLELTPFCFIYAGLELENRLHIPNIRKQFNIKVTFVLVRNIRKVIENLYIIDIKKPTDIPNNGCPV